MRMNDLLLNPPWLQGEHQSGRAAAGGTDRYNANCARAMPSRWLGIDWRAFAPRLALGGG